MVIIISGSTHVGKTYLAQKLLEKFNYPYLSIDHLKMGLIRSNNTNLTPLSCDADLIDYLWPIVVEIIKTAIENKQNLIIEGCYVPFAFQSYFEDDYLREIKHLFLIMSNNYIMNHFDDIKKHSCVIEKRLDDDITKEELVSSNQFILDNCISNHLNYEIIDENYLEVIKRIIINL